MSSSDPARYYRLAFAAATAFMLSACTVQPLYGPTPAGTAVATSISQVAIDPVDTRVAQVLRNKLLFDLDGGKDPATAVYRMKLSVASAESALGVTPIETAPAYSLTVSATYEVTSIATGQIVLRGTSRGTASFDRVTQAYANTRAKLDAEDRAATEAADDIRIRLATAAAKGTI
jgi:LPS-assembly lipoprotein